MLQALTANLNSSSSVRLHFPRGYDDHDLTCLMESFRLARATMALASRRYHRGTETQVAET